jgi:hypothetical protein
MRERLPASGNQDIQERIVALVAGLGLV